MSKPFKDLIAKMPDERQKRIKQKTDELKLQMTLSDLRKQLGFTQTQVAEALNVSQAAVSKIEHQADLNISTLRKHLASVGADLKIVARFPDHEVEIDYL